MLTESFWRSVLDMKTFNSVAGRAMQREAKKKLEKLERGLPEELLARLFAFYLDDAPYDRWGDQYGVLPRTLEAARAG